MMVPSVTNAARRPASEPDGRVRPDAFVRGQDDRVALALLDADRGDFAVEHPVLGGPGGALVGRGRHLVLGGAVDAQREVLALGGQAHGLPVEGVGQAVMGCDVERLDGTVGPALPGTGEQVRCAGHGLLAAGDDDRGVAAADHPGGVDHGGQPGQADLVDGHGGDVPADAGADGALAGGVLARPGLQDLAHDHRVHLLGLHSAGGQGRPDGVGAELHGREAGELPVEAALGRAGGGEDDNIIVVCRVAHGFLFRSWTMYSKVIVTPVTEPFGAGRPAGRLPARHAAIRALYTRIREPGPVLAIPGEVG